MQVKDAMCMDFRIVSPDSTVAEAARLMRECDCGWLPLGENDRLTGAVTDRDIVIRAIAEGRDPEAMKLRDIQTRKVQYCFEDEDIEAAARQMEEKQVRRLAVLNRDKRMTGVLSVGDIARCCDDKRLTGEIECKVARAA